MQPRYIVNRTNASIVRVGKTLAVDEYYLIPESRLSRWANSSDVLVDLSNEDLVMAKGDDGSEDLGIVDGINFLKGIGIETQIKEEFFKDGDEPTGGRYQAQSFEFDITHDIGTWDSMEVSFPYPTSLFSTEWINETLFENDIVKVEVAPNTIIGSISSNVSVSDTVINVSQTVVDNIRLGYLLNLFDGTNSDDLGRVIDIDKDALTVTVETASTIAFASSTPTYARMTIQFIPHIMLKGLGRVELAKDVVGGSYIPANSPITVSYKNVEGTTTGKCFSFILEYKY